MQNNPFLTKPLKKINNSNQSSNPPQQQPQKEIHKINEHRASKFINIQNNIKSIKHPTIDKKQVETQKNTTNNIQIQKESNTRNNINIINQMENRTNKDNNETGFKNILKKFGSQEKNKTMDEKKEEKIIHKKRASIEKYINPKIEENFKKENEIVTQKNFNTNNSDPGEDKNDKKENQKIQVTIKETLFKKVDSNEKENNKKDFENTENLNKESIIKNNNIKAIPEKKENLISFKNDDEILEYIKNKVKEGKIQNIYQKLELKNNDFSGFSISKKNQGYTIYEIKVEEDITKINEIMKKQKIEIKNKPIQFIYTDELESLIKIKKEYACLKEITFVNVKNDVEKSTGTTLKQSDKSINKTTENKIEKKNETIKNKKNYNSNNISVEGTKSKRRESEFKEKMVPLSAKKPDDENKFAGIGAIPEISDKKAKEIQSQKRASKAYNRFKKAFSLHKDKENEKNTGNSDKIHFIASMLQEHIMKPLNEIQEENEGGGKIYRGGSVECRQSKVYDNNIISILENAPVTKKNVKKPKLNNFDNN